MLFRHENVYKLHLKYFFQVQFAQKFKNIKILLIFLEKYGTISALQKITGKSTHSLTDKIPDSGSGAGGSIPSGCI